MATTCTVTLRPADITPYPAYRMIETPGIYRTKEYPNLRFGVFELFNCTIVVQTNKDDPEETIPFQEEQWEDTSFYKVFDEVMTLTTT